MSVTDTYAGAGYKTVRAGARSATLRCAHDLVALDAIPVAAWSRLFERAAEPNIFYAPAWSLAACNHARGHDRAKALLVWEDESRQRLIGLLPVVSAWRALKLPVPLLVAWQGYAPLATPLLDRDCAEAAARGLLDAAKETGAHGILLPFMPENSAAAEAFRTALAARGLAPRLLRSEARAMLDASVDAETMLYDALGARKLKELRRQRNRLADEGEVAFNVARAPEEISEALEQFLALEATGWKGRRGTALGADQGNATFIREASSRLARKGSIEIATLSRGGASVAAGIVLKQGSRAWFYKVAYDEALAKASPGVQFTLELTRHLCADPAIAEVDSTASANHPMIDHVWKKRLAVSEMLLPTGASDSFNGTIQLLVAARRILREGVRTIVHRYRAYREKN